MARRVVDEVVTDKQRHQVATRLRYPRCPPDWASVTERWIWLELAFDERADFVPGQAGS